MSFTTFYGPDGPQGGMVEHYPPGWIEIEVFNLESEKISLGCKVWISHPNYEEVPQLTNGVNSYNDDQGV
ncbi:MAG: hypothetical protein PUE01_04510 [Clostridiaceae bacterium]|nr:hypothetical protein [Clostridiaceae bacterium]